MSNNIGLLKFLTISIIFFILFNSDLRAQCIKEFDFIQKNKIEKIKITVSKNRKWLKTLSKLYVQKSKRRPFVQKKRKYQAKITIDYVSGKSCSYDITLRAHGGGVDHLDLVYGMPITSMRIKLNEGNLRNVTRFKLLIPISRYSYNEIFISTLLRHLGIISPKTFFVL